MYARTRTVYERINVWKPTRWLQLYLRSWLWRAKLWHGWVVPLKGNSGVDIKKTFPCSLNIDMLCSSIETSSKNPRLMIIPVVLSNLSDINDCEPNPCMNGASCMDRLNDYNCSCADGFEGENCQTSKCFSMYIFNCSLTHRLSTRLEALIAFIQSVVNLSMFVTCFPHHYTNWNTFKLINVIKLFKYSYKIT